MNSVIVFVTILGKYNTKIFFAIFSYIVCFKASAYGQLNPSGCGKRPFYNWNKIVGGSVATPGDWGWQVSLC